MTFRAIPAIAHAWFIPDSNMSFWEKAACLACVVMTTLAVLIFIYQHSLIPRTVALSDAPHQEFLSKPTPDEIEMEDQIRSNQDTIKYMQGQMQQMGSDIRTLTVNQAQQEVRLEAIEKNTGQAAQNSSSVLTLIWTTLGINTLGLGGSVYFIRRRKE